MNDHARMIAAAKRLARRTAKKTDITYQQALDQIARDLGRRHWADYMADPVEVPRDIERANDEGTDHEGETIDDQKSEIGYIFGGIDWNLPEATRKKHFGDMAFIPSWNILSDKFVGREISMAERQLHIHAVTNTLMPASLDKEYFGKPGRLAMEGFLMAEVAIAHQEGRTASIVSMIDWIRDGFINTYKMSRNDGKPDGLGFWIDDVIDSIQSVQSHDYVAERLRPLAAMKALERTGILGTMDRGLLPFKNREVRALNW